MDVVTVCYAPELHFLKLQARSMARHLDPASVGRMWVILNEDDTRASARYFERHIAPEYGPHRAKVTLLGRDEVSPGMKKGPGWRTQQVLKLRIADRTPSPCYIMLDAKNHFIRPVSQDSFFDGELRFRTFSGSRRNGALAVNFIASYEYFGVDVEAYIDNSPPGITPFGMRTGRTREMIAMVEAREGDAFETFFMRRLNKVAEIFMFQAFAVVTAGSYDGDFVFDTPNIVTLWRNRVANKFRDTLASTERPQALTFAVHRKTLADLNAEQRAEIGEIWRRAGLIEDAGDVELFCSPFESARSARAVVS